VFSLYFPVIISKGNGGGHLVQTVAGKNELAMHMNITAKSGFGDQRGPGRAWTWPSLVGQAKLGAEGQSLKFGPFPADFSRSMRYDE
jgi:hypothetical protein